MARKNSKRQRVQKPNVVAWSDVFARFFRLGDGDGWTPPKSVSCRQTTKGYTFMATFLDEGGRPVKLTTRVAWTGDDRFRVVDEQLSISMHYRGGAS